MKNNGFMKVFKFSYVQAMKSKSNRIMMSIFMVVSLLFFPAKTIISDGLNGDEENKKVSIDKVYVDTDNEELFNNFEKVINAELVKEAEFVKITDEEYDDVIDELKAEDCDNLLVEITFDEDETSENFGLYYKLVYGNGEQAEELADDFNDILSDKSKDVVIAYYGISEDVAKTLVPSEFKTTVFDADGNEVVDNSGLNLAEYWFTYGVLMALIMVVSFIGSSVAEGIVSEKSNKVIEYIMINLKPMDLIIGKVLASMAVIFTMVLSVIVPLSISSFLNIAIDPDAKNIVELINVLVENDTLKGVNFVNVLLAILIIVGGTYFFAILGGLSGGMVSKIEEMSEGLKIYMMFFMIGAYLAMFMVITSMSTGTGWGNMSYVVYLLPISSMFILPAYLIIGKVATWVALVALLIIVVVAALLTWLATRIFGQMLYHNGSPMKLKDIISMTKEGKKNEE